MQNAIRKTGRQKLFQPFERALGIAANVPDSAGFTASQAARGGALSVTASPPSLLKGEWC
jgi:hypothetical protein